ncbi:5'-nucleotidase, partial [Jimgerdemannia flammicorona]
SRTRACASSRAVRTFASYPSSRLWSGIRWGREGGKWSRLKTRQEITSTLAEHSPTAAIIAQVTTLVSAKTSRPIGYTCTPLDGLFSTVRTRESNLGNLTADLMQHAYATCIPTGVDFAICNGGVLRGDAIIDKGVITLGDIMNFFPFEDPVVVIRISGARVLAALENSFAEYPKQEGRFPQVAGLRIEWDPKGEPGARVRKVLVTKSNGDSHHGGERQHPSGLLAPPTGRPAPLPSQPQGEPLDLEREYVLATREYMAQGGDGFTSLVTPPHDYIVDGENGMLISALFRRYFLGLKYVNAMRTHFEHECTTHKRVVEAAHVWRLHAKNRRARGLQAAAGPESGTESGTETPSGTEISESGSGAETDASSVKEGTDGAAHSTTKGGICDALTHSVKGRPCCLRGVHGSMAGEDVEDTKFMRKCEEVVAELGGEKSEEVKRESKETEEGQEEKGEEEDVVRWVREWASVGPLVEGRIVEVAEQ